MDDFSQHELLQFWQNGKPLNEAIWKYCDPQLIKKYEQIEIKEINYSNAITWLKSSKKLNEALADLKENKANLEDLKNAEERIYGNLSDRVIRGELIAVGYKYPIESEFPAMVPLHMWPPECVEILKSAISANGIAFIRIRIIERPINIKNKSPIRNTREDLLPDIQIPPEKRRGRPSYGEKIDDIYSRLKDEGKIDFTKPMIRTIELIRHTIWQLHPELNGSDKGLGNDAIGKRIASRFNADKLTDKSADKL